MSRRSLVVVSAGLSQPSSTRLLADQLAAATRRELEARGEVVDVRVVELREHAHDLMNNMLTGFPSPELKRTLDAVTGADGLIAVTPIFNASYSGLFKSFFDVVDTEALADKPVLIAATGGTARHSLALEHAMRPMFAYLRAVVVPTAVYAASEDWGDGAAPGAITGELRPHDRELRSAAPAGGRLAGRIDRAGRELAHQIGLREGPTVTDPFDDPTPFEQLLAGN